VPRFHLNNILKNVMLPAFKEAGISFWSGWHGFRRGLATNLRDAGIDDLTISEIMRHSDVSVTRASYIKKVPQKVEDAMNAYQAKAGVWTI